MAIIKDRVARAAFGTSAKVRRGIGWGGKGSVHSSIPKRYRAAHRRYVEYTSAYGRSKKAWQNG